MAQKPKQKNIAIQQVLAALLDEQTFFPPAYYRHFSDLEGGDIEALRSVWPQVSPQRRINVIEDLEDLNDSDTLVLFDNVARMALTDSEPRVRAAATRLLWETGGADLIPSFIDMMLHDPAMEVRAGAASALGSFVYQGELEELPQDVLRRVEDQLLAVTGGQDEALVRRRALEALGFSSRDEVPALIQAAYQSPDADWVATALFAIGRSANEKWSPEVLNGLRSTRSNILLEAVRAAGELELDSARRPLLHMLEDDLQDTDIRAAVFWSLSKIGGEDVREVIEQYLDETEDEEEAEYLESVLDNLSFTEDFSLEGMFDFDALGEEANMIEVDLEDAEEEPPAAESDDTAADPKKPDRKRHKPKH